MEGKRSWEARGSGMQGEVGCKRSEGRWEAR